jgi:transcriptional regulator with GAF, ATPase, and Fis domain
MMIPDGEDSSLIPSHTSEVQSCAAVPIMREGKVAGALLVSCRAANFFTEEKLTLLERYADLIRLAFSDEAFVDCSMIELALMPEQSTQKTAFSSFRQRVNDEYRRSVQGESLEHLNLIEARVRQAIETELLHLATQTNPV